MARNLAATLATDLLFISSYFGRGSAVDGHLDDIRISKGIARWTAAFTHPGLNGTRHVRVH